MKYKFKKLKVLNEMSGISVTTDINGYGEQYSKADLQVISDQSINTLMHAEHDFSSLPIGRIKTSKVNKTENGSYGCYFTADIFADSIQARGISISATPAKNPGQDND